GTGRDDAVVDGDVVDIDRGRREFVADAVGVDDGQGGGRSHPDAAVSVAQGGGGGAVARLKGGGEAFVAGVSGGLEGGGGAGGGGGKGAGGDFEDAVVGAEPPVAAVVGDDVADEVAAEALCGGHCVNAAGLEAPQAVAEDGGPDGAAVVGGEEGVDGEVA